MAATTAELRATSGGTRDDPAGDRKNAGSRVSLSQLCHDLELDLATARERAAKLLNKDKREVAPDGSTLMTVPYIKQLCREQKLYQTEALNDKLYLHFKGFSKIENLTDYTGLRALWLEGNGITKIENLDSCKEMRCLFLHQNCISQIENLAGMPELDTVNLSNNLIRTIPPGSDLSALRKLKTLQIANNFFESAEDLAGLRECPSITILDLSQNKIGDSKIFELLEGLPELAVLNLMGNPVIGQTPNYRRSTIARLGKLTYLDDRPVFDTERRTVQAWARGGLEAERIERQRIRDEERDEQNRGFETMRQLQEEARARRLAEDPNAYDEPEFPDRLRRFRDGMLRRIEPGETGRDADENETETDPPPLEHPGMESGEVEVQPISCAGQQDV